MKSSTILKWGYDVCQNNIEYSQYSEAGLNPVIPTNFSYKRKQYREIVTWGERTPPILILILYQYRHIVFIF